MDYTDHIDSFSIYCNICAQKSLKRTCPVFDLVTPSYFVLLFNSLKVSVMFGMNSGKNFYYCLVLTL